jgi:hypothetical protein
MAALHPVGCEAYLHARVTTADEQAWVVLEGLRWITLESLELAPSGAAMARTKPWTVEPSEPAEVGTLADALRTHVRELARHFPDADRLLARIDKAEPERLADLVIANLPVSVEAKARYAEERRLAEKLKLASALAGLGASAGPT